MSEHRYEWVDRPSDSTPYGVELAARVADFLTMVGDIAYVHKEYCGMGLGHRTGQFVYGEVYDGDLDEKQAAVFPDRTAFIAWLANQSDQSLSGRERDDGWYPNNQRITRARLKEVLRTGKGHAEPSVAADGGA